MSAIGGKADIAAKLLTRDDARRIAVNIAKLPELSLNNRPTELCAGGPFVANGWLDLLLFCGIALHVKIIGFSPRLATFHAGGVPCLTMFCASVAPRLMKLLLTGLFLTLLHTGHRWSGRCRSAWCWSGWLHLSLSI